MIKSGIYRIVNETTGRVYVGSAANLLVRKRDHFKSLRGNYHRNTFLQRAWNKYGEFAFRFETIELVEDVGRLIEREQFHLSQLSFEKDDPLRCYNICQVAGSLLGTRRSAECRARMSALKKGKSLTAEHRAKMSAAHKGKVRTAEHEEKLAATRRGRKKSDEFRRKVSDGLRGKKPSPEVIAKRAASLRGRKMPEGHGDKLREVHRSLTVEQVADIVARRKAGESYVAIAKDYDTTKDTIRNWCLKEGVGIVNVYTTPEQREEMYRRREAGEPLAKIAADLGVNEITVYNWHRKLKKAAPAVAAPVRPIPAPDKEVRAMKPEQYGPPPAPLQYSFL